MMVLKRKTIIIITLVLLIVAAGYISTKYGKLIKVNNDKEEASQVEITETTDAALTSNSKVAVGYFVDIKLGRENQRVANKQLLNEMINNENTSKEAKKEAEQELLNIVKYSNVEMVVEALIKAKGYEDALVFIVDNKANVTVKSKEINADNINQIKNIVCKETGINPGDVMIQCREN